MAGFDRGKRRVFLLLSGVAFVVLVLNLSMLSGTDVRSTIKSIPIPGKPKVTSPEVGSRFKHVALYLSEL